MDPQFQKYLDERFDGINRRLDEMATSFQRDSTSAREDKRDIYQRIGSLEERMAHVQSSSPTYNQLVAASGTAVLIAVAIVTVVVMIVSP